MSKQSSHQTQQSKRVQRIDEKFLNPLYETPLDISQPILKTPSPKRLKKSCVHRKLLHLEEAGEPSPPAVGDGVDKRAFAGVGVRARGGAEGDDIGGRADGVVVKNALHTDGDAVLLDRVSVEAAAREPAVEVPPVARLAVESDLGRSVRRADHGVKRTREELGADAVAGLLDDSTAIARLSGTPGVATGLVASGRVRRGRVGHAVTVGSGNDDVEAALVLAHVGRRRSVNPGAVQSALEVDGRSVAAAGVVLLVQGVALDVDVERLAELGAVAKGRASIDIVAVEGLVGHVGVQLG